MTFEVTRTPILYTTMKKKENIVEWLEQSSSTDLPGRINHLRTAQHRPASVKASSLTECHRLAGNGRAWPEKQWAVRIQYEKLRL